MKYIKLYETFNKKEIDQTLKEICLELEDDGYEISISSPPSFISHHIVNSIKISKGCGFPFSDIKEYLLRMKEYLGDNYIQFNYLSDDAVPYRWREVELNDDTDIKNLNAAQIVYKNE